MSINVNKNPIKGSFSLHASLNGGKTRYLVPSIGVEKQFMLSGSREDEFTSLSAKVLGGLTYKHQEHQQGDFTESYYPSLRAEVVYRFKNEVTLGTYGRQDFGGPNSFRLGVQVGINDLISLGLEHDGQNLGFQAGLKVPFSAIFIE